jgi:uncharacterized membrane protein
MEPPSDDRMRALERRLAELEHRLETLERLQMAGRAAATEPVRVVPPPFAAPPPVSPAPSAPASPPRPPIDLEYVIGARFLPKVAALALIGGLAFLVSVGVTRGWITQGTLFAMICLASAGFIGAGIWKRDEREEFGQILTGVGACGLYLNFAAGHLVQNLYGGSVMVALFLAVSALSLAYGAWRASRAFLFLGSFGGYIAALMPLEQGNLPLALALLFSISLPAAAIATRHRWPKAAVWMYVLSSAAAAFLLFADPRVTWWLPLLGWFGVGLLWVAAYAYTYEPDPADPQGLIVPLLLGITGVVGFGAAGGSNFEGPFALGLFSAGILAIAAAFRQHPVLWPRLLGMAIALPLTLVPWQFEGTATVTLYAGIGGAAAGLAYMGRSRPLALLGGYSTLLGLLAYLVGLDTHPPLAYEETLLGLLLAATVLSTLAFGRANDQLERSMAVGQIFSGLVLAQLLMVVLSGDRVGWPAESVAVMALAVVALLLIVANQALGMGALAGGAVLFAAFSGLIYVINYGSLSGYFGWEFTMLLLLTAAVAGALADVRRFVAERELVEVLGAIAVWLLLSRLGVLVLAERAGWMNPQISLTATWITYSIVLISIGFWLNRRLLRYVSIFLFGVTSLKIVLLDLGNVGPEVKAAVLIALGLAMLGGGYWYIRRQQAAADDRLADGA